MAEIDPFQDGDSFLRYFLPGTSPAMRSLRGTIYRLNIEHKNHGMVPSILLLGEPGVGKGYSARVISAHMYWLQKSHGIDVSPTGQDVYKLASEASLRIQTLTNLPEELAEATLFGAKQGAYTDLKHDIVGIFDSGKNKRPGVMPDPFDIFLDEIGDASPNIQAKLLEILESKTFRPLGRNFDERESTTEARVIIATNRNLAELVEIGRFREDLYSRLLWAVLELPPLRAQIDQLPVILSRINDSLVAKYDLSPTCPSSNEIDWAKTYSWPGNHREVKQVIWEWHLHRGSRTLEHIVRNRRTIRSQHGQELGITVMEKLFQQLDSILAGNQEGYGTYGSFVDSMQRLAYAAIHRFNKERRLTDGDLERLFHKQKATNIRKQISDNRPRGDKEREL